jgi:nucleotide-binding universal stress UspA family protein
MQLQNHPEPKATLFMMIKHILVPLDFSANADSALAYAIDMASHVQAHLTLCHVIPTLPFSDARLLSAIAEVEDVARAALEVRLQRVRDTGLEAQSALVYGDPWQKIVETAAATQTDLIIMATQGYTGLQEALLGSVTIRVLRFASCPVCVIPPRGVASGVPPAPVR